MHARLSILTATAAVLLATSAMAAPQTPPAASSPAPAASSTAAPAARTTHTNAAQAHNASSTTAMYRNAQQKLKDMGLYTGPVDGSRNASFVSALRKYQHDHHLQVSGRLNGQTQRSLGI